MKTVEVVVVVVVILSIRATAAAKVDVLSAATAAIYVLTLTLTEKSWLGCSKEERKVKGQEVTIFSSSIYLCCFTLEW